RHISCLPRYIAKECSKTILYLLSLHDALPIYVADDLPFDFDAEQAHWHMSGEDKPDYNDILERIVLRDSGQRSASDQHQELVNRSEEHTSELQSRFDLVCRLLLEKKKNRRS